MKKIDKKLVAIISFLSAGILIPIIAVYLHVDSFALASVFISLILFIVSGAIIRTWDNKKGGFLFWIGGITLFIITIIFKIVK